MNFTSYVMILANTVNLCPYSALLIYVVHNNTVNLSGEESQSHSAETACVLRS